MVTNYYLESWYLLFSEYCKTASFKVNEPQVLDWQLPAMKSRVGFAESESIARRWMPDETVCCFEFQKLNGGCA